MKDSEYLAMRERVGEEVNRLKAQNAQLITALEECASNFKIGDQNGIDYEAIAKEFYRRMEVASAALAAATGGKGED